MIPPPKKKRRPLTQAEISDTSCRVGMICGLLMGVSERACNHLIKLDPKEFFYRREAKIVRSARRQFVKKGPRS
jgi:hypothetical protein